MSTAGLQEFFDSAGGFAPSFKFQNLGDSVVGTVTRLAIRETKSLQDPNKMVKNLVVGIQPDDGDEVTVWIKPSQLLTALTEALQEAGVKATDMSVGDKIAIEFYDTKPTKLSPQKLFRVKYRPTAKSAGISLDDL